MPRRSQVAPTASAAVQPQPRSDAFDVAGYDDVVPIGFGGASTVYRARQMEFDRLVAVKVLTRADASVLRRFDREKRILGRLSGYPSIAQVFDAGVTGSGAPYLVMQYHPGGSLADLVRRGGPQPLNRVLPIGVQLAATLDAAHALGVLHRDIKPGNVMIDVMQQPVLADFGISGWATGSREHTAALTYHYAAPEVVNDPTAASTASDQYSLALTLWALLVGGNPWQDLAARRLAAPPADVPAEVAGVLQRALEPVPGERFPSCIQFADSLRAAQERVGLPVTAVSGMPSAPDSAEEYADSAPAADIETAAPHLAVDPLASPGSAPGSAPGWTAGRLPGPGLPRRGLPRRGLPRRGLPRRGLPRTVAILLGAVVAVAFSAGAVAAVIDLPQTSPVAIPLVAPSGVAAAVDGDTVVVTWEDTNGGRLPYFVYRTGSGEAALMTDPGARTASFPILSAGAGLCFRVGVLDATEAATSDEVCAVVD